MRKTKRSHHYAAAGLSLALFAGMTSVSFITGSKITGSVAPVATGAPMQAMQPNQMLGITGFDVNTGLPIRGEVQQAKLPWMQRLASGPETEGQTQGRTPARTTFGTRTPTGATPEIGNARESFGVSGSAPANWAAPGRVNFNGRSAGQQNPVGGNETSSAGTNPYAMGRPQSMPMGVGMEGSMGNQAGMMRGPGMSENGGMQSSMGRGGQPGQETAGQGSTNSSDMMVARLEMKLDQTEAKIAATEQKLAAAEAAVAAATSETAQARAERTLARLETSYDKLVATAEALQTRIDQLSSAEVSAE